MINDVNTKVYVVHTCVCTHLFDDMIYIFTFVKFLCLYMYTLHNNWIGCDIQVCVKPPLTVMHLGLKLVLQVRSTLIAFNL